MRSAKPLIAPLLILGLGVLPVSCGVRNLTAAEHQGASSGPESVLPDRPMPALDGGRPTASSAQEPSGARPDDAVPVPEPSAEALRYHRTAMWLWAGGTLLSIAIPAAVLFSGLSGRMWRWSRERAGPWLLAAALFTVLYFVLDWLLTLPLNYYRGFAHPKAYGLSNQTAAAWLADSAKELGFLLLLVVFAVPAVYGFLRRTRQRWWLYAWCLAVLTIAFVTLVHPVLVAPAFDDFGRMRDDALEAEILALADRAGVDASVVYEVDKSEDTERVNAYVTGILGTRRIVLWDTLLEKLDREQVLFVMGHEMGHYVLKHTWTFIVVTSLVVLLTLYVAHRILAGVVGRFQDRIGFNRVEELASFPLLLLVFVVISLALQPLQMAFSRYQEHEADRFALELTRDNRAGATGFVALLRTNLSVPDPGPVYRIFLASHPVLADRIRFANTYRPWESGRAMRYSDHFREAP